MCGGGFQTVGLQERRYQIVTDILKSLSGYQIIQRLLGKAADVSENDVAVAVGQKLEAALRELGVQELALDPGRVDWATIIAAAVNRDPPFSKGSEKGFRDALIGATIEQFVSTERRKAQTRSIIVVTNDDAFGGFLSNRLPKTSVRVVRSLEDATSFLHGVESEISEARTQKLRDLAATRFFRPDDARSLFFTLGADKEIWTRFRQELQATPSPPGWEGLERRNSGWAHRETAFEGTDRDWFNWSTVMALNAYLTGRMSQARLDVLASLPNALLPAPYVGDLTAPTNMSPGNQAGTIGSTVHVPTNERATDLRVAVGETLFVVKWRTRVRRNDLLSPELLSTELRQPAQWTWVAQSTGATA